MEILKYGDERMVHLPASSYVDAAAVVLKNLPSLRIKAEHLIFPGNYSDQEIKDVLWLIERRLTH